MWAEYQRSDTREALARPVTYKRVSSWLRAHGYELASYGWGEFGAQWRRASDGALVEVDFSAARDGRRVLADKLQYLYIEGADVLQTDDGKPWGGLF